MSTAPLAMRRRSAMRVSLGPRLLALLAAAAISIGAVGAVPGDIDGDGVVGGGDLNRVLLEWGPCGPGSECEADLNGDGVVDGADQSIVLEHWGLTGEGAAGQDDGDAAFDAEGLFSTDEPLEGLDLGVVEDSGPIVEQASGAQGPAGVVHVVPLPAPAAMVAMGVAAGVWWRRRIVSRA